MGIYEFEIEHYDVIVDLLGKIIPNAKIRQSPGGHKLCFKQSPDDKKSISIYDRDMIELIGLARRICELTVQKNELEVQKAKIKRECSDTENLITEIQALIKSKLVQIYYVECAEGLELVLSRTIKNDEEDV